MERKQGTGWKEQDHTRTDVRWDGTGRWHDENESAVKGGTKSKVEEKWRKWNGQKLNLRMPTIGIILRCVDKRVGEERT